MDVLAAHAARHPDEARSPRRRARLELGRVHRPAQPPGPRPHRPGAAARRPRHRLRGELAGALPGRRRRARGRAHPRADESPAGGRGGRLHPRPLRRGRGAGERSLPAHGRDHPRPGQEGAAVDPARIGAAALGRARGRPAGRGPARSGGAPGRRGLRRLHHLYRRDHREAQGGPAPRDQSARPDGHAGGHGSARPGPRAPGGRTHVPLGAGRARALHPPGRRHRGDHAEVRPGAGAGPDRAPPVHQHLHGPDPAQAHRGPARGGPGALRRVLDARHHHGGGAVPDEREGGRGGPLRARPLRVLRLERARGEHGAAAGGRAAQAGLLRARGAGQGDRAARRRRPAGADRRAGRALRAPVPRHPRRVLPRSRAPPRRCAAATGTRWATWPTWTRTASTTSATASAT